MSKMLPTENLKDYFYQLLNTKMGENFQGDTAPMIKRWLELDEHSISLTSSKQFLNEELFLNYVPTKEQPFLHNELWEKVFNCQFNDEDVQQHIVMTEENQNNFSDLLWRTFYNGSPVIFLPTQFNNDGIEDIVIKVLESNDVHRDYYDWSLEHKLRITLKYAIGSALYQQNNNQAEDVYIVSVGTDMYKEDRDSWSPLENTIFSIEQESVISSDNVLFKQTINDNSIYFLKNPENSIYFNGVQYNSLIDIVKEELL